MLPSIDRRREERIAGGKDLMFVFFLLPHEFLMNMTKFDDDDDDDDEDAP